MPNHLAIAVQILFNLSSKFAGGFSELLIASNMAIQLAVANYCVISAIAKTGLDADRSLPTPETTIANRVCRAAS